jgi:hypothetical protein
VNVLDVLVNARALLVRDPRNQLVRSISIRRMASDANTINVK